MEGSWFIKINDESHSVKAVVKIWALPMRLTILVDGTLVREEKVFALLGVIGRVGFLGHDLAIKVIGYGALGRLGLLVDGVDSVQLETRQPSLPATESSLDLETSIVEVQRVEESLGEEVRIIDNSKSVAGIHRTISVVREWTQAYVLERETSITGGAEISVRGAWAVDFKASAEGAIRKRYEISVAEKKTYSEELTIEVPAKTKVRLVLHWKQIWQRGVVVVRGSRTGAELQFPYKVCVGPTFDQSQVDI